MINPILGLAIFSLGTAELMVAGRVTGRLAYRHSLAVMVVDLTILSISLLGMALFVQYQVIAILAVILIGLSGVSMNPAMMARIVSVAHPGRW